MKPARRLAHPSVQTAPPNAAKPDTHSVKSAERVLTLLETIGAAPNGATFTELHTGLGIPKSSLYALLEVLTARNYIESDPVSRRYVPGVRLWETGIAYHRHHGILKHAHAIMETIVHRVNETVQFAKLAGGDNVYLAKVDSTHALRLQSDVGARLSAHATGIGKALLAELDEREVRRRFPGERLQVYTRNTIANVSDLLDELSVVRERGFAIDNEEYTTGVFCLAVPVFDGAGIASHALSVSVPTLRASRGGLAQMLAAIAEGSAQISAGIGFSPSRSRLKSLSDPAAAGRQIDALIGSKRYRLSFVG
jgi:DNA-binding IclR family transcriptional regulator